MPFIKNLKLFYKFLCLLLPFLGFSIVLTSLTLSWLNYHFFRDNIRRNYQEIVRASAGEIRQFMVSSLKNLESLAKVLAATKVDLWQQDMALVAFRLANSEFMALSLVTPEGALIVSTRVAGIQPAWAQDETFRKAAAGEVAFSGTLFSKEGVPYAWVGVPVMRLGKVSAVLWGELGLKTVWNVLDRIRVGETGRVYIANLSGRFVVHSDMERVIKGMEMEDSGIVKRLAESQNTVLDWVEREGDGKAYCLGLSIPDLGWILVLNQDDREAYTFVYRNMKWTALLTLLLCLAAVLIIWLPVKRFLAPIQNLHRQVQRFGAGELDERIQVESRDEIGDLSAAFNRMADSLRNYIEREVERTREVLHARNLATLGAAAGKVTHEVGNLLSNIAFILLSLKREPLSVGAEEAVRLLENESDRVKAFIRNLLQFARKPELRLMRLSLDATLHDLLAVYSSEAETRGIRIELDWSPDLPPVDMDAHLIYQVVNNLVKNSLEAMGGKPGVIRLEGKIEAKWLQLTVRDTGPGIVPAVREQIFNPFFTTKGKDGTGLGLSICRNIMEAHHGTLECLSEPGELTAFILRLPLEQAGG